MNVVLYGDSNTYGLMPSGMRYKNRYSNILKSYFKEFNIYEEGLVGRTTIYNDRRPNRNASLDIKTTLLKYNDIDLLVIMLGTNDYKSCNAKNINDLKFGMEKLLKEIEDLKIKDVLLISPIILSSNIEILDEEFNYESYLLSKEAHKAYEEISKKYNLFFLDANNFAKPSIDGEHLSQDGHKCLAYILIDFIKKYFNDGE